MSHLTLEQKTKQYWDLAFSYHGRTKKSYTFSRATQIVQSVLKSTNPDRKLHQRMMAMHTDMIYGAEDSTATSTAATNT